MDSLMRARGVIGLLGLVLQTGCSTLLVDNYNYGKIEVFATLESGEPAEGIVLILYRDQEHLAYGTTNAQGQHTFSFVPFGSVGVYAQLAPTHITADSVGSDYRDKINVADGSGVVVTFTNWRKLPEPVPADEEVAD